MGVPKLLISNKLVSNEVDNAGFVTIWILNWIVEDKSHRETCVQIFHFAWLFWVSVHVHGFLLCLGS